MGIHFDESGQLPVLHSVRTSQRTLLETNAARGYLLMEGLFDLRMAVQDLLFGADSESLAGGCVATVQAPGCSGTVKVGADFLRLQFPEACVSVSDPTWDNHWPLFEGAGLTVQTNPY